jgi:hypothetical protein
MKHTLKVTDTPKTDGELIAAATLVLQHPDLPLSVKAKALKELASFTAALGKFEIGQFGGHSTHYPVIREPEDPEPGFDKVWRLVWRSTPMPLPSPTSPAEASPAPARGIPSAPVAVTPPAPTQPTVPPVVVRQEGFWARLSALLFGR